MLLSWLMWDPSRELFLIPFVERAVGWYGALFALGFLCGYYILLYFFRRFLCAFPQFSPQDISWPKFARAIEKNEGGDVLRRLSQELDPEALKALSGKGKMEEEGKKRVVDWVNSLLESEDFSPREEGDLGKSLRRILRYAGRCQGKKEVALLKKRLFLEKELPSIFTPLAHRAKLFCERLSIYVVVGTVAGARLGHLLFYESFSDLISDPLLLFRVWEGGLASHGGVAGIFVSLWMFLKRSRRELVNVNWLRLVDFLVVPAACASVFIRVGNFFNQEILGKSTTLPWAVVFMHPADGGAPLPRHPAQLYEALFYAFVFLFLFFLYRRGLYSYRVGRIGGLFFLGVFGFRFGIEYLKEVQSFHLGPNTSLLMGQYLSLPLLLFGAALLCNFRQIVSRKRGEG